MNAKKLLQAGKNGTLIRKTIQKLGFYHVKNKNAKRILSEINAYERLQKKYHSIIAEGIDHPAPAEKSNKIWICWLQGYDQAPAFVKACIHSVRQNLPDREIIIITDENLANYIDFPEYIIRKRAQGVIPAAHYSDLIRCALLCKHGGIWIDATVLCTAPDLVRFAGSLPLFVFKELTLSEKDWMPTVASSWFIAADSNQPILLMTQKLLYAYWKENNYLDDYFLFHLFFAMASRRYEEDWNRIPLFNNHSPHVLGFELDQIFSQARWDQILKMSDIHKLTRHLDYSHLDGSTYRYILDRYSPPSDIEISSTKEAVK